MINTQIRQLRDSIIKLTNDSPLPIEVKRLVFSEIASAITSESEKIIDIEKQANVQNEEQKNN